MQRTQYRRRNCLPYYCSQIKNEMIDRGRHGEKTRRQKAEKLSNTLSVSSRLCVFVITASRRHPNDRLLKNKISFKSRKILLIYIGVDRRSVLAVAI